VHMVATVAALSYRARFIGRDKYFSETGHPQAVAVVKLFVRSAIVSFVCYLVLNVDNLISAIGDTTPSPSKLSSAELILRYLKTYAVWAIVPACCGVTIAYALERSDEARLDRLVSGMIVGTIMAVAALVSVELTLEEPMGGDHVSFGIHVFVVVLYGGLGLVLGYMLPAAIRRHWAALEKHLPDKIAVLRTEVLQYFRNIQQFTEWLTMRNEGLNGRRPLDVLTEETGLQQLTSFVAETRTKAGVAGLAVH
jgi:hypothetical protein